MTEADKLWNKGYRAGAASRDAEVERLREAVRRLVATCTPMSIPSDKERHGVCAPAKSILEQARASLAMKAAP